MDQEHETGVRSGDVRLSHVFSSESVQSSFLVGNLRDEGNFVGEDCGWRLTNEDFPDNLERA